MQKYLKITQEEIRKACEISHRMQNSFFTSLLSVLQVVLFLGISHALRIFRMLCEYFACFANISHSHVKLLDVRFLLGFSSLHTWLIWKRLWGSPKLGFFMCLSFNLLFHGLYKILPHSWLVIMIKKLSKHQNLPKID